MRDSAMGARGARAAGVPEDKIGGEGEAAMLLGGEGSMVLMELRPKTGAAYWGEHHTLSTCAYSISGAATLCTTGASIGAVDPNYEYLYAAAPVQLDFFHGDHIIQRQGINRGTP